MRENGLTPSIAVYSTLLKAMLQSVKICGFISLLKAMVMEGCQPNEVMLGILNQAMSKGWTKKYPEVRKLLGTLIMR